MKTHGMRIGITALILFSASLSSAEEAKPQSGEKESARFMLRPEPALNPVPQQSEKTDSDFAWASLTKNGPASGGNPVVGEGSGKAFYEFADGRPHPFYIQPPKQ